MSAPATVRHLLVAKLPNGSDFSSETDLRDVLHEVERVCSLPFWLEEICGQLPGDAELLSWITVADVERWLACHLHPESEPTA